MSKVRAACWSLALGVTAVVVAATLFRMVPGYGAVFLGLLALCCAFFAALIGALVEVPAAVGLGGGAFAGLVVAAVLGMTIAVAPLQPGARRPGLADLFWLPLLAGLAGIALCAAAGWFGLRTGLRFARRHRRDPVRPPP